MINNRYTLAILSLLVVTTGLYSFWVGTGIRADVFLFYDFDQYKPPYNEGRLVSNIFVDVNNMIITSTLLLLWRSTTTYRVLKRIILPFLIISVIDIFDYFFFYKQFSVIKLPILLYLILTIKKSKI